MSKIVAVLRTFKFSQLYSIRVLTRKSVTVLISETYSKSCQSYKMKRFVKRSILDLQALCILNKFHVTVASENQNTAVNLNLGIRKGNCQ